MSFGYGDDSYILGGRITDGGLWESGTVNFFFSYDYTLELFGANDRHLGLIGLT
jgi:hypothetical protein